jgi:hypothetical protein
LKKVGQALAIGAAMVLGVYLGDRLGSWLFKPKRKHYSLSEPPKEAIVCSPSGEVLVRGPAGTVFIQPGRGEA